MLCMANEHQRASDSDSNNIPFPPHIIYTRNGKLNFKKPNPSVFIIVIIEIKMKNM